MAVKFSSLEKYLLGNGLNPAGDREGLVLFPSRFSPFWFLFHRFKIYVLHPVAHND